MKCRALCTEVASIIAHVLRQLCPLLCAGALMGMLAAGLALCFMHMHWGLKKLWLRMGLHVRAPAPTCLPFWTLLSSVLRSASDTCQPSML